MIVQNKCAAEIYSLIEDEAEAIKGYYNFISEFYKCLTDKELDIIEEIITEEKDHMNKLQKIQENYY